MTAPIRIAIAGALGRMGQAIAAVVEGRDDVVLAARFDRPDVTAQGLVSRDEALAACDVVIDFTTPAASVALAQHCAQRGGPALVIGATGISDEDGALIDACAAAIPIVRARNFSLGVNMLMSLVTQAAKALAASDYDIEVFEAHHRRKVDSPSGTALMLGEAAAEGRGVNLNDVADRGRDGIHGPRKTGDIGFSVLRGGDIIGEHSVIFAAEDEILTLSHSARDRGLFARGAVQAALWVGSQPKGAYNMQDVLKG
ncbi:MAG: 4-hydroxy-tetrahydrodipicolinate reductase [Phenylobacterium sp.]|uniref:4-hydroxy-tetrahydrodipicolinate reductase n=1 Tax=Phenylobacterium sp. TaxID=1871053 RepID=UPI00271BC57B|nr:4-hydroxy-tetrahydrodipicolinate reductase [Phenylobacterium sp.]MDO8913153.1 4-hydroxy-tetrahydrodipicolinate reductase [Phenylobacterium sp.]MDP3098984.1 4-hydroxy-tetrahydrodipicolinate reductase [Phenylobacterium sp.]HQT55584.1 4-hydroxy-tetrahydrodipicolinate reductase [Phenylobacterium sp.]